MPINFSDKTKNLSNENAPQCSIFRSCLNTSFNSLPMYDRRHGSDSIHLHRKMREQEEQERIKRKKENAAEKNASTGNSSVSEPDDVSEKEADVIAKKVVSGQSVNVEKMQNSSAGIQRKDEFKATDRISGNGKDLLYALVDENGVQKEYEEQDKKKGPIFLPEGTQIVKLSENPKDKNFVKVFAFMEGKYREGYVSKAAFGGTISKDSPFTVDAFINDAERTVYNSDLTYANEVADAEKSDKQVHDMGYPSNQKQSYINSKVKFRSLVNSIRSEIEKYKAGKLKITPSILQELKKEDDALMLKNKSDKTDHPEVVKTLSKQMYSTYDPGVNGKSNTKAILYVPLTAKWMETNLSESSKSIWKNQTGQFADLTQNAGYVLSGDDAKTVTAFLKSLKTEIKNNKAAASTPEGKWIVNTDFSKAETVIVIESQSWDYDASSRYASEVPLNASFGMLNTNPIMTLMAHETNMVAAANYTMGNTHIGEDETKLNWAAANEGGLNAVKDDGRKMDSLFQAHSSSSIIALATYFKRIREKQ